MLTARREPLLHPGEHDPAHAAHPGHAAHPSHAHSPGFTRFMTVLQVVGSIVGIPLGLVSGYSIYHANFSVEARCQGLRANIVSMLDKSADASTLRILVRRDVANFEKSCGAVDPDAVAAFKTLLASGKKTAAAPVVAPVKEVAREPVRRQHEEAKREVAKREAAKVAPAAEAARERRDAARADAKWVASVREALIHTPAERARRAEGEELPAPVRTVTPPTRASHETHAPTLSLAPPAAAPSAPAARQAAPTLPPAASVAATPPPTPDHPVPPESIPEVAPPAVAAAPVPEIEHGGLRGALAQIPLLGQMFGK